MYPLKFENIYFEKIWGGRDFESFRNNLPDGKVGESWDVACHTNGMSIVENGEFKGKSLGELIDSFGDSLLGTKIGKSWFPLLVKLINARDSLSVQVHPDDEYGMRVEGDMGKTEVWYVVDAFEGATLVLGTKKCSKENFEAAIAKGFFDECMNRINVKTGDVYLVKSGLVHAIGSGVVIAELQQNSDTTYRVYDYNRGRELHIKKALDVMKLELVGKKSSGLTVNKEGYSKTYYCLGKDFVLEEYSINCEVSEESDEERFFIFTCVEGSGSINYNKESLALKKGDSILIPATLGSYTFRGEMKLFKKLRSTGGEG